MKQFQYLKTRAETQEFFDQLKRILVNAASKTADHTVVFRPTQFSGETLFFADHGFWALLTMGKAKNRYWNCFGLGGQPQDASNNIAVEINHPYEGLNRRIAGRFLVDDTGRYAIAHSGRLGGGVEGFTTEAFLAFANSDGVSVQIDNKIEKLALLAYLDQQEPLLRELADFTHLAADYRQEIKDAKRKLAE